MTKQRTTPHLPRLERLPPALIPVLYFGFAHLSLIVALAVVTLDSAGFAGFFYHPRGLAVVHLITLGWISATIVGALYVVGPLALRVPMPTGRLDFIAFLLFSLGTAGMAGHFWIGEYSGIVWSTGNLLLGLAFIAHKVLRGLATAAIPRPVKMHIALAFFNLFGAGLFGLLLGIDKHVPFLAGDPLSRVYAHAHLAALGWAIMMVMGVGYRLLPMLLPSAVPSGRTLYVSGVLLEVGSLGLFATLLTGSRLLPLFALVALVAFIAFLLHVLWMRRNLRKSPIGLQRPDYGVRHAMQAIVYGGVSAAIGCVLALMPRSDDTLRCAVVYGMLGLIAFLAQMVIGVEARILPVFVSIRSSLGRSRRRSDSTGSGSRNESTGSGHGDTRPGSGSTGIDSGPGGAGHNGDPCVPALNPHELIDRRLQATTFYCWTVGLPVLAIGLGLPSAMIVGAGGGLLLIGSILAGINIALVIR